MGLLLLGLTAPIYAGVADAVVSQFTDPFSQIMVYFMLPGFALLFIFVGLFFDDGGGGYGYR